MDRLMLIPVIYIAIAAFGLGWIACTLAFWGRTKVLDRIEGILREMKDKMPHSGQFLNKP